MLFNSLHFLIFFPTIVVFFFVVPQRTRWFFLLCASYYFYMSWKFSYGLLLLVTTVFNYGAGISIEKCEHVRTKKILLWSVLAVNLGILFFFKYFNFFFETVTPLIHVLGIPFSQPALRILLPLGISFHTFQVLGYIIDVYRGARPAERHFGIFALYISFFPQSVAGPVERSTHLLPQLHKETTFRAERIFSGLRLMLWGFFLKLVIADGLAFIVNQVYAAPTHYNGFALLIATTFFMVQIYADFAGYSDIARGSARILGYELILNFDRPYFARSISEFWKRWHISLTTWFQEYVFTPLYLSLMRAQSFRGLPGKLKHILAFSVATIVGLTLLGLWHGAGLNFIVFGLSQALFIILYHFIKPWWDRLPFVFANLLTLCMVGTGFIFFRAKSFAEGVYILKTIFVAFVSSPGGLLHLSFLKTTVLSLGANKIQLAGVLAAVCVVFVVQCIQARMPISTFISRIPLPLRWALYYVLIIYISYAGTFSGSQFIYFQF